VAKLTDQDALAYVAKKDSKADVRLAAVAKLTDQYALADIAKNAYNSDVRAAAVAKLTDQSLIAYIAKNDSDKYIRAAAVANLTDQSALADIAKNDSEHDVCAAALAKLTDPKALKSVAEKYLLDISVTGDIYRDIYRAGAGDGEWQKVQALISIAKEAPQLLKENWRQINNKINMLHGDTKHWDNGMEYSSSDCNEHRDVRAVNDTARSKGLVFPPYPFDD
jgi:hypothetical protein